MDEGRNTLVRSILAFALLMATSLALQSQPLRLYVDNSNGDDVSVIDLESLKVIGDVKVGAPRIHGLALRSDGKLLAVTVESDHSLRFIDTHTYQTTAVIKLNGRPNQCAITPDGRYIVVPIRDGDKVDIVDVGMKQIVKELPIKEPHNAVNIGSNRYTFVSSMGSNQINVVDLKTLSFSAFIPAGGRPRPYVLTPDGKLMYVALANLHGFEIVDVAKKQPMKRVEIPAQHSGPPSPRQSETPDTLTHGLALSRDGKELWVTSLLDNSIYIYDIATQVVVGHLPTGDGPNWVVFSPDGKYACVSNTDSDDVSIFDVKQRREITRIKVGTTPKRLAVGVAP